MNIRKLLVLGAIGISAPIAAMAIAGSAEACTPHPDYPDGCDGINGRYPLRIQVLPEPLVVRPPIPFPGPTCLSCPPLVLDRELSRDLRLYNAPLVQELEPQLLEQSL